MPVTLARHAMATRFEILLEGANEISLRAAGEEALDEIERIEARLSLFRPTSEIAHVNAEAARRPVRVSPEVFALLEHAQQLHQETGGAFDITIAPLMKAWGFQGGSGHLASPESIARARECVGMHLVRLDPANRTVSFARPGVMIDLGAIGKGYAIECAANTLREAGMTSALLHGGTSTVYALGTPPEAESWLVQLDWPVAANAEPRRPLATVPLRDEALSVSGSAQKHFESAGAIYGHVLDPRTGQPGQRALLAAVVVSSGAESDALSTALLVLGAEGHTRIANLRPAMRTLLVTDENGQTSVMAQGLEGWPLQGLWHQ